MSKVRVHSFTISSDGYGAGPNQDLKNGLGMGGENLHAWMIGTRTFQAMSKKDGGTTGVDDEFTKRGFENIGAWVMGRNMFGPIRGPWPDDSWKGWWGKNPPYHCDVFVLTHQARSSEKMEGGTTFHFVTDGIYAALDRAKKAADGKDVRIGGGVSTIRKYLDAGLIDEMHLAISPILLGSGEHLLSGKDLPSLGYGVSEHATTPQALHLTITKRVQS
jgi:dihydrofolate reductase